MTRIGLISDTHGLLRPEAMTMLRGCDQIIHGGDIWPQAILQQLAALSPVIAVRGNNDTEAWAEKLPETLSIKVEGVHLYVIHDLARLDIEPLTTGIAVVISGHSHRPLLRERDAVLYINPGSAGPRRFKLPVSVAELTIDGSAIQARILELPVPATPSRRASRRGSAAS